MGSGGSKSQTKHVSQSYGHDTSQAITRSGYSDVAHNHNVGDGHQFLDDNVTPQIQKTTIQGKYGQYHLFLEHTDGDGNMRACSDIISKYRLAHAKERCEEEKIKYPDDMIYVAEGCWDDTNIRGTPPGIVEHQYKDRMVMALYRTYWYECFSDSLQNESGDWFKDDAQTEKATELQIGSWTYVHADPRVKARFDEYGDYNVYDDIYSGYGQHIMLYNNHPYDEHVSHRDYNYNVVFILSLLSVFMGFCVLIACIGCIGGFIMCVVSKKLRDDGDKSVHDSNIV